VFVVDWLRILFPSLSVHLLIQSFKSSSRFLCLMMKQTLLIIAALCCASVALAAGKPNILFILADDMGYSDMSWQGSPIQTPNLDKLRAGGMFLERNYVQPQCTPSRVAFLTGNYPYRFGLHEHIVLHTSLNGIPGEVKTIAEKMQEGGYRTSVIGKWHVGSHLQSYMPHHQGFDHSFIGIAGTLRYWNYTNRDAHELIRNGEKVYANAPQNNEASGNTYATDMWAQEAIDVINRHDEKDPLFMFLSFNAPHHPLDAKASVLAKYDEADVDPYWSGPDAKKKRNARGRTRYMALVDSMDTAIGNVIAALKTKGVLDNTLIVFCSDNGGIIEADNRPLRSGKGDSFEGAIRVPGIAYWPGKIKSGSTSSELVYMADWYATFAQLAGMQTESYKDGISAWDVLQGKRGERRNVPIVSSSRHALITGDHSLVGGGSDYQQLVENGLQGFSFFDLNVDVSQAKPTSAYPEAEQQAEAALAMHLQEAQRGYFNWDIKYAHTTERWKNRVGDHSYDIVVNDMPELKVSGSRAVIAPLCKDFAYQLQGTLDGNTWYDIAEYVSKQDAASYTFPTFRAKTGTKEYRVQTAQHFGLPAYEHFGAPATGELDAFLPNLDEVGNVSVANDWLELRYGSGDASGSSRTRYFIVPHSRGKIYASMKIRFEGLEPECVGQINWLRQNGWNGKTVTPVSLQIQSDGVTLDHTDTVRRNPSTRLSGYDGQAVNVLFEFDLGTTGKDTLKVYLNPGKELSEPAAVFNGEFTFDRLQFALAGRGGSTLMVDDVRIGTRLQDVQP
jgi:arylsulfatase A-like enzyme